MYNKPKVVRFGTLREVTRGGGTRGHFDWAADNLWEFFFSDNPTAS